MQGASLATRLVALAEAIRIVPPSDGVGLERSQVDAAVEAFARAGVGRRIAVLRPAAPDHSAALLLDLLEAIAQSPLPTHEWGPMADVLGEDLLATLVGASTSSIHRYRSGDRATPDHIAARLHTVTLICVDLAGSYNDVGVRRWFHRPRHTLAGSAPADVLSGGWSPDDERVGEVRDLAASLLGSPAT